MNIVKRLILQSNKSYVEIAKDCDLSRQALYRASDGKYKPQIKTINKLAKGLKVDAVWLAERIENEKKQ